MSTFDVNYKKAKAAAARRPKTTIENAVKAAQIYQGSSGSRVRDQDRLYQRMERAVQSLAKKMNMDYNNAFDQITGEAQRRGAITAMPGKHY
jgi:Skp family chaperone for outer membrane proteins